MTAYRAALLAALCSLLCVSCSSEIDSSGSLSTDTSASSPTANDHFPDHALDFEIEAFENSRVLNPLAGQIRIKVDPFLDLIESEIYQRFPPGYAIALLKDGQVLQIRTGNFAQLPRDGGLPFTETTKLHVASTSKALTALAILDTLREKGMSVHNKIAPFLPDHWERGPGVNDISFYQLLTHRSGLRPPSGTGLGRYSLAKLTIKIGNTDVADGRCDGPLSDVPNEVGIDTPNEDSVRDPFVDAPTKVSDNPPTSEDSESNPVAEAPTKIETDSPIPFCPGDLSYQNPMFVLAKIVATVLDDRVSQDFCNGENDLDGCWNDATTKALVDMFKDRLFTPAGLPDIDFKRGTDFALAYGLMPDARNGRENEPYEDLVLNLGAVGLYLSIEELSRFVAAFMSETGVVSTADRIDMLTNMYGYGWDFTLSGRDQTIGVGGVEFLLPEWGGSWRGLNDGNSPRREINSVFFFPGNVQVIVMYNSPIPDPITSLDGSLGMSPFRWIRRAYVQAVLECWNADTDDGCL